jgi:hypothetical protein
VVSTAPLWPAWLSITPDSSEDIMVSFNAINLDNGDYDATIIIAGNDPTTLAFILPVHLYVSPTSVIEDQISEHIPKSICSIRTTPTSSTRLRLLSLIYRKVVR